LCADVAIFCTARQEQSDRLAALYEKDAEKYGEEDEDTVDQISKDVGEKNKNFM
jgi:hypothetical protein